MATMRLRLLCLMAAAMLVFGACSNAPAASTAASGSACAAGAGTNLQIPDVEAGKFNVAMVLIGPHDDGGWSQAHYEGLQYICDKVAGSHVA
jgi:basic membrane lipoprotein Med (substrate-binding protein (PBP1-ABC) superfamily)